MSERNHELPVENAGKDETSDNVNEQHKIDENEASLTGAAGDKGKPDEANRRSKRLENEGKLHEFKQSLNVQSEYHASCNKEVKDPQVQKNYDRLNQMSQELENSITAIHSNLKHLTSTMTVPKDVSVDVDRLTRDHDQLQDRINERMSQLSVRPREPQQHILERPTRAESVTSRSSRKSSTCTSSLRAKALEARAAEEAKKAELEALAKQEEQEEELAALKIQQEREITRKLREIQRTKIQGEIVAEQRRRVILEEAAAEETGVMLMRPPSIIANKNKETEDAGQKDSHQKQVSIGAYNLTNTKPTVIDKVRPQPLPRKTLQKDTTRQQAVLPTHSQLAEPYVVAQTPPEQTTKTDQTSLAEAILNAINYSVDNPKLETPKPYIFTGKLTDYPDWRASVNRFIIERRGTPEDKLALLRSYLSCDHHKLINAYCTMGDKEGLTQALAALDEEFGDEFQIGKAYKRELQQWTKVPNNDVQALKALVAFLKQCASAMSKITILKDLDSLSEQQGILKKLPIHLERKWIQKTTKYHEKYGEWPKLLDLCNYLQYEVKVASNPLNDDCSGTESRAAKETNNRNRARGTSHAVQSNPNTRNKFCIKCSMENHHTSDCGHIAKMEENEKQKFMAENQLCFHCLIANHSFRECKTPVKCKVSGCDGKHATVNHNKMKVTSKDQRKGNKRSPSTQESIQTPFTQVCSENHDTKANTKAPAASQTEKSACLSIKSSEETMSMLIMPVYVTYKKGTTELLTYALVDSMSDRSFISEKLINNLNVSESDSVKGTLTLHTMTHQTDVPYKEVHGLKLRGYGEQYIVSLPAMTTTTKEIPINRKHIPTKDTIGKWKHLRSISDKLPPPMDINVGILLGANVNAAHTPLETIVNSPEEPYAKQTVLGWSVTGSHRTNSHQTNRCYSHRIITKKVQDDAAARKTVSFINDQPGLSPQQILDILESDFQPTKEEIGLSLEDKQFLSMLTNGTYHDSSGYITMPLPFKQKPKGFGPQTRNNAEHRFKLLLQKFQKEPTYEIQYKEFMNNIISHGDAEMVDDDNIDNAWYIPHFGIFHPKKPDKIRVVFDCAAKSNGKSLNDYLLQGPDMMNNMLGILMRFRCNKIAISCDIERMFHQFKVKSEDRDYLRFIWINESGQQAIYRMKVHLFGARSSPACATFGLRYLAESYGTGTCAEKFISTNFYVDDGLISVRTIEEAISLVQEVTSLCRKGNIRLHKFVSNNIELLTMIPESERGLSKSISLINVEESLHRTLGIQWNTSADNFSYDLSLTSKDATRRALLSAIASIFDPLGLISPIIIKGKILLQECCKNKLNWDDQLPPNLWEAWLNWTLSLERINTLNFRRCCIPADFGKVIKTELHSFSDASREAYGAVVYLRLVDDTGKVSVSLVYAKARVAPSSITSIPRLELQAAVLSTILSDFVEKQITDYQIDNTYYYTDSQIVLGYLNNETRRFHVFVANRAQKIRNYSHPTNWNYVPTKLNPADHASRGLQAEKFDTSLWVTGPPFLYGEDIKIPNQPNLFSLKELDAMTNDVRTVAHAHAQLSMSHTRTDILLKLNCLSDWSKIVHLVATMEQYKRFLGRKHLQKLELKTKIEANTCAEKTIIVTLQANYYSEEIQMLRKGKATHRSSPLHKLDPFLDPDGILRIGGRLEHSQFLEFKDKHPVILPKSHIASCIVKHYHDKAGHQGRRSTLAQLRLNGYWVVGGHAFISSTIDKCVTCKKLRAVPNVQKMSSLPAKRTEPTPPFTYVGCDIFGPFVVKDRRSDIKRYGALFTCMASKAIHIEMVDDMTTDAFLNALRCIIAIRGPIRQIHTDRGTNFIGAANELHGQIKTSSSLAKFATKNNLEFITNVPYASHMGGIWERQIRSIRAVMSGLLKGHNARLDSASLRTLFYEIMAIINCRPITATDKGMPLNPNMLLTMKTSLVLPPPGDFDDTDIYSRKRWRRVQRMANEFWERWKVEYIQNLQTKQKWTTQASNMKVGDVVLLKEIDEPRNQWPLARIVDVIPSKDGLVRKVRLVLATANLNHKGQRIGQQTVLERPIHKTILIYRPACK